MIEIFEEFMICAFPDLNLYRYITNANSEYIVPLVHSAFLLTAVLTSILTAVLMVSLMAVRTVLTERKIHSNLAISLVRKTAVNLAVNNAVKLPSTNQKGTMYSEYSLLIFWNDCLSSANAKDVTGESVSATSLGKI